MANHDLSAGPITLSVTPVPGPEGKDAYQIACENGFTGTAVQWLASLQGSNGPSGMGSSIPGGRLTLVSGHPVMKGGADYTSTVLYYAPFQSDTVPLFDGIAWGSHTFTSSPTDTVGASMVGGAAWAANTSRDVFSTKVNGEVVLCTGPAWPSDTLSARSLGRLNGIPVNAGSLLMDLSATEQVTVAAHQATYVGSISTGATAGLLKATFTIGQNRTCDVWNFYHQQPIKMGVGCRPVAPAQYISYTPPNNYSTAGFLPYNNDATCCADYFTGMPQDIGISYIQRCFLDTLNKGLGAVLTAVGKYELDTASNTYKYKPYGTWGSFSSDVANVAGGQTVVAEYNDPGFTGRQRVFMCSATANDSAPYSATLWSLFNVPGRQPEDAQVMWIKYQG